MKVLGIICVMIFIVILCFINEKEAESKLDDSGYYYDSKKKEWYYGDSKGNKKRK